MVQMARFPRRSLHVYRISCVAEIKTCEIQRESELKAQSYSSLILVVNIARLEKPMHADMDMAWIRINAGFTTLPMSFPQLHLICRSHPPIHNAISHH